jgi:hypothetical protein
MEWKKVFLKYGEFCDSNVRQNFKYYVIDVLDLDNENLIVHFPKCIEFISDAVSSGGILIHW